MQFKKIPLLIVLTLVLCGCANDRQNQISLSNAKQTNSSLKTGSGGNTNSKSTLKENSPNLQTKTINWSWAYSPRENSTLLSKYHAYAFGETSKKVIYLTFDEGYENGYTASILDTLKANNVKAAFFVTKPYVTGSFNGAKDIDLVKRMMNEGHIIGNHSVHHKSMPSITNEMDFNSEITENETTVNNIPGLKMSKFFRPPMGDFSELSLYYTQKLGYKSVFFTLAYKDYEPKDQPNPETAKKNLLKQTKPGMICLLHAVSETNTKILDSLIKEWKSQGYEFKTLNDLP
ncbi:polysaccharide deacetylase family protein [Clostridium sp. CF011]|uniref:polysaccharide deacetylase family protein n=1 Tax=unclassified Clostridium TaxID=2614128 RepID=UPI001C0CF919|nr:MULTISPECIES: polysaccharide deacetylase family protein [unclassified Clostridium]MBU3091962.1 polysaccharide deacetylase family protein [Clostridium sp. CF011]MBW9145667.1 polysaccharide deacetylase family protein [Clostridium sp. CM027]UVE41482.1 polysaccharide deacetylase family protein [Clostridium sp. CM027]WAG70477.1 polysaccharide deacetylase family protein [Clostridium sp. CF011]